MSDLQYTLGIDSRDGVKGLDAIRSGAGSLAGMLAGLGATAFAGSFLARGFRFNQTMRDSEAAIGKVISQFQGLNDEAAKGEAAKAMQQLVALEPKAAGTLNTLVDGFLSTLAASQSAGLSVQQNIDLVGRFANAMANANIPTEQLGQEMRSIVTGNIGADSSLARILGITNEMVATARESGNVYGFLVERIGKLGEAGDTAAVAFSSLQSAVDKAAGALAQGLFDSALDGSKSLTTEIEANMEAFTSLGRAVGVAATELVKFGGFVSETLGQASRLAAISAMMLQDGLSYGEAAAAIDAVAAAREADTAAAQKQAEAVQKAVQAAAPTTSAAAAPGRAAKPAATDDPFEATERLIEAEKRLSALKRSAAMEQMTTGQKLALLSTELSAAAEEEANLRADPFGGSKDRLIESETRRVEIQREINQLKRQEAAETERAANATARAASQAAAPKPAATDAKNREASGDERYGPDGRRLSDGRSKIRSVQTPDTYTGGSLVTGNRSIAGPDGGMRRSGIDTFNARQQTSLADDIRRRQAGGPLDRFNALQTAPDLAARASAATTAATPPAPASAPGNGNSAQTPELAKLTEIHAELLRIRTA